MLGKEENELLTRVGKGTPMGELLRQYWQPALFSSELPEPEGRPVRVRLLGEDLVAFRDSAGRIGLLGANCCHRGAPLFFGRNEDGGLRCMYHGWKYDVTGQCLDMPNVPAESDFKEKVRQPSYPTEERNGIIWTYMGPRADRPLLPDLEWAHVPPDRRVESKQLLECNWVQALEGDLDPSHISFLHAPLNPTMTVSDADDGQLTIEKDRVIRDRDKHPLIMCLATDYGLLIGARREADARHHYWRITHYFVPFYAFVPGVVGSPLHCNIWQPVDDENCMVWRMVYRRDRTWTKDEIAGQRTGWGSHTAPHQYLPPTTRAGSQWFPVYNRGNDYGLDYDAQRTRRFSGVPGIWAQDRAATEGMGPIMDRTQEHLGPSDIAVIQMRRLLIRAARALRDEATIPPGVDAVGEPIGVPPAVSLRPRSLSWGDVATANAAHRTLIPTA